MKDWGIFLFVVAAIVIAAATGAGCTTQSITTKAGDFGSSTPPVSIVPPAPAATPPVSIVPSSPVSAAPSESVNAVPSLPVSVAPSAAAGGISISDVSVVKGGADGTTLIITYNGNNAMGNIRQIEIYTLNSDGAQYEAVLKPLPGETVELKGTKKPDRVMAGFRLTDGSWQRLFDKDF